MAVQLGGSTQRRWVCWVGLTIALAILSLTGRQTLMSDTISGDFICFWTGAEIIAQGGNPYDADTQTCIQREYGWDKDRKGLGIYEFLPYYYPPWLAFVCLPLLPFGHSGAKAVWFFMNAELSLTAGFLVPRTIVGIPPWVPIAFVCVFLPTVISVVSGQCLILAFFLIVASWWLLENGWDRLGGVTLAWVTIKPQLAGLLILGVALWMIRQHRWRFLASFAVTGFLLCLAGSFVVPLWPLEMWQLIRKTPPPTEYFPWIGTTWSLLLKTAGASGPLFWLLYLPVALGWLAAIGQAALEKRGPLCNVFSLVLLGAFFVAPYARHYDFPVLLIPLLVLMGGRLSRLMGTLLLMALVALPYLHFVLLFHLKEIYGPHSKVHGEFTFFWIPLLLAGAWLVSGRRGLHYTQDAQKL